MKKISPFAQSFSQLPNSLPIFPLSNAIVMPRGYLSLNIFEPRYLNMFQDSMRGEQLIGMIQPKNNDDLPNLFDVGCAARISRYEETNDGRLEVVLSGLCRFSIEEEISSIRGYRIVVPSWKNFASDYDDTAETKSEDTMLLHGALRQYFTHKNIDIDWDSINQVSTEVLLHNLIAQLPITPQDKQILIETPTLRDRIKSFCAIIDINEDAEAQTH